MRPEMPMMLLLRRRVRHEHRVANRQPRQHLHPVAGLGAGANPGVVVTPPLRTVTPVRSPSRRTDDDGTSRTAAPRPHPKT